MDDSAILATLLALCALALSPGRIDLKGYGAIGPMENNGRGTRTFTGLPGDCNGGLLCEARLPEVVCFAGRVVAPCYLTRALKDKRGLGVPALLIFSPPARAAETQAEGAASGGAAAANLFKGHITTEGGA